MVFVVMQQATPHLQCLGCGFDADAGDEWEAVEDVNLGSLTRCPECKSTNVQHKR
jgi:predicted Zn-ribbon and HTH transcriptional regulator